jgi:hypothetical protein
MPPLSINFAKYNFDPGFPLGFIKNLVSKLTKLPPHHFLMPLAQKGIHIKGGPSFQDVGRQFLAPRKGLYIFKGIVTHLGPHEPFESRQGYRHDIIYGLFELEGGPNGLLHPEDVTLFEHGPFCTETLGLFRPVVPFLDRSFLFQGCEDFVAFFS